MTVLRTTIFGRQKIKPNTFIGGMSSEINSASKVLDYFTGQTETLMLSHIKAFKITGTDVSFYVSIPIITKLDSFVGNSNITYFKSLLVRGVKLVNNPNLTVLETYKIDSFIGGLPLISYTKVEELRYDVAFTLSGNQTWINNSLLKRFIAPLTNFDRGDKTLQNNPKLEFVDMRSTKRIGRLASSGVSRGNYFYGSGILGVGVIGLIKVHEDCLTADSGGLDVNVNDLVSKGWNVQFYNSAGLITSTIP